MLLKKFAVASVQGRALVLGSLAAAALAAVPASGALTLTLSEAGYTPVTATVPAGTSSVVYATPFGDFTTNLVVGYANDATPSSVGQLQIQSLDVINTSTSSGAKTLTISLTDNSFTFPGTVGQNDVLASSLAGTIIGGSAGDHITFQSTATPSGGSAVTPGVQTYTDPTSNATALAFNIPTANATFGQTGTYTLSNQIVATFSTSGEALNLSGTTTVTPVAVPEPVSLSLMGIAGFGLLSRRRRMF